MCTFNRLIKKQLGIINNNINYVNYKNKILFEISFVRSNHFKSYGLVRIVPYNPNYLNYNIMLKNKKLCFIRTDSPNNEYSLFKLVEI